MNALIETFKEKSLNALESLLPGNDEDTFREIPGTSFVIRVSVEGSEAFLMILHGKDLFLFKKIKKVTPETWSGDAQYLVQKMVMSLRETFNRATILTNYAEF